MSLEFEIRGLSVSLHSWFWGVEMREVELLHAGVKKFFII
jgi:hypothetical protein